VQSVRKEGQGVTRLPLDPDPLAVEDDALWDPVASTWVPRRRRRDRLAVVAVVAATTALLIVAFAVGRASATPRSASDPDIPAASIGRWSGFEGQPASGNLAPRQSGASLPRNVDEALAFVGGLTPDDWASFRLGLGTVLAVVAIVGLAVWLWRTADRR
jgi:hypothetical protein